jgi:hypothetical protein
MQSFVGFFKGIVRTSGENDESHRNTCIQFCGAGTAEIVTLCLSGIGTAMHYGSGSVSGIGFGYGSNIKCK